MSESSDTTVQPVAGNDIQNAPTSILGTLARLGPGMILAGAIVGSGELIATTRVGAQSGMTLLWLILLGCLIKVFVQVELGRSAVAKGRTALEILSSVPGPRLAIPLDNGRSLGGHITLWLSLVVMVLVLSQQGGIVGGVGEAMSMTMPLTEKGRQVNEIQHNFADRKVSAAILRKDKADPALIAAAEAEALTFADQMKAAGTAHDPVIWAGILAVLTAIALYIGHYGFIQWASTIMVAMFTALTIMTVLFIQLQPRWALSGAELVEGLKFRFPIGQGGASPIATALAAFGIIGVGAIELLMYPYWCIEKGYARWTGPADASPQWLDRAKGWLRIMKIDVWVSMVVYTVATLAFYWLGAAVLGTTGLVPGDDQMMIRTLSEMYVPVFGGPWARTIFLVGAFAVLYSTYFVAAAGCARLLADGMGLFGLIDRSPETRNRWTGILCIAWPLAAYLLYVWFKSPVAMVLASGIGQGSLLPIIGMCALYHRYHRCDDRLKPGIVWDIFLWLSVAAMFVAAGWTLYLNAWVRGLRPWLQG